jgi:hypothetical protein
MFTEGNWVVRATTNHDYLLDCTPERMPDAQWRSRVVVYLDGAKKTRSAMHTAAPKIVAFDTSLEAAEMARLCGERWIATHEKN